MADIKKILKALDSIAPFSLQCEWDNSGLVVDSGQDIENILLCLDVTPSVIAEAVSRHANLIISHHPIIFNPLSSIAHTNPVYSLCRHTISCIAMHTNLDAAQGGVNDRLAELLGMMNTSVFEDLGRVGELKRDYSAEELAKKASVLLNCTPRFLNGQRPIRTLAVVGGSCSMVEQAYKIGADCLLTGEVKHNDWLTAERLGISLVEAGHFSTEWPIVEVLYDKLYEMFDRSEIECFVSAVAGEPSELLR